MPNHLWDVPVAGVPCGCFIWCPPPPPRNRFASPPQPCKSATSSQRLKKWDHNNYGAGLSI